MENTQPEQPSRQTLNLSWPLIIGLALFFAGVSESLRNFWRLVEGEDALISLIFCLACLGASIWIIRKERRKSK